MGIMLIFKMKTNVMIILKTVKNKKERNVKNVKMILYKVI
jgi:hypothetical protein